MSIKSKWQHLFIPRLHDLKRELVTVQAFQLFSLASHFSVVIYLIHVKYQDCATKHVLERRVDDMWFAFTGHLFRVLLLSLKDKSSSF